MFVVLSRQECELPSTPRSLDRNATRATLGFGGKSTDLSMGLSPTSIVHVSASPRCHPGRSDFPSPVGDHGIFPVSLPSPYGTFIHYSSPVLTGAPSDYMPEMPKFLQSLLWKTKVFLTFGNVAYKIKFIGTFMSTI